MKFSRMPRRGHRRAGAAQASHSVHPAWPRIPPLPPALARFTLLVFGVGDWAQDPTAAEHLLATEPHPHPTIASEQKAKPSQPDWGFTAQERVRWDTAHLAMVGRSLLPSTSVAQAVVRPCRALAPGCWPLVVAMVGVSGCGD